MMGRVLVVDDDIRSCEMLEEGLRLRGFDVLYRLSATDALDALAREPPFHAVLTDLRMPHKSGLDLLQSVVDSDADLPVIVATAFGNIDTAVRAVRLGAYDFITKPFDLDALSLALERAARHRTMRLEIDRLRRATLVNAAPDEMVGESAAMRKVYALIDHVAELDVTLLVTGESGTGKDLAARAVHRRSRRADGPFIAVNCAAIPEHLLESELFGHAKGAFTDAKTARTGLMAKSTGGTLFLDEIGDMPLTMQAKLLRVLQDRVVRPLGTDREVPFDTRIIAATHQDLEALVAAGRFRQDLYFRINVVEVTVPPLRMRGNDILLLAQRFIDIAAARAQRAAPRLTAAAAERLLAYDWPGNVRELANSMERVVALAREDEITEAMLPPRIAERSASRVIIDAGESSELVPLEEIERRYIRRVLEAAGGNKKLAAEILGLDRSTLYRKLERYERASS